MKFDSYHPGINFLFFVVVFLCTICFRHPVYLAISFFAAFVYSVGLKGIKTLIFNLCLLLFPFLYTMYYSYYTHFGVTNLRGNIIDNQITLEAVVYGLVRGFTVVTIIMWMICLFEIFTTDKIVYLLGRVSPKLSLFFAMLLRMVPRIKERAIKIGIARTGIGKGIGQGNLMQRFWHLIQILSILITWFLENLVEIAVSMKSRGYSLKGRTAFSIYRFDNRDRSLVIFMFGCLTGVGMAVLFDQTKVYYDPVIVFPVVSAGSIVFWFIYGVFLLLPFILQLVGGLCYNRKNCIQQRRKNEMFI